MSNTKFALLVDYDGPDPSVNPTRTSRNWRRLTLRNIAKILVGIFHGSQFRQGSNGPKVTFQDTIVQASATATPAAVQAADTLSIGGTALTATQGRASGTITCATAVANDTITINGVTFTGVNGAVVLGEATFDVRTSDTACATSIAAQVNAYKSPLLTGLVEAKSAAAVVTVYAKNIGTSGNALTLASSSNTTLAVSGATLANGAALTNNQFDYIGTDVETGTDIARAINASTTAAVNQTTATVNSSTGVVTVTALPIGAAGNAITFTSSSNTRLAVTGSGKLAGGSAGAPVLWTF